MSTPLLSPHDILRELATRPGWAHAGNALVRSFDCKNFNGSMRFINAVAEEANALDHHPDIAISWNEVRLSLSSHDSGGLTQRDFRLADLIDAVAARPPG